MDDISASQFTQEGGPIGKLSDEGSEILHAQSGPKWCRRLRVDWHEPRVEVWISSPRAEEASGLDCLAAKDLH